MGCPIKLLSMNCQGLGDLNKCRDVFHFLRQKKYDIYLLQDTHFTQRQEKYIRTMWGLDCVFDSFSSQSRGVAILFNSYCDYKIHHIEKGNDGNKLILDITIHDKRLTLVNLYGPNRDKPNFYRTVKDSIVRIQNETVIIGADFNLILDPEKDSQNYLRVNNPNAREAVLDICAELNLIDIWREQNLEKLQYTWKKTQPFKQARLDFFIVSEHLFPEINNACIEGGYRTDHSSISISLDFQKHIKAHSYWKFNNSLLKDSNYVTIVKNTIKQVKEQYSSQENPNDLPISDLQLTINDQLFLETLLMEIRGKTVSYCSYKKKSQDKREHTLLKEINDIEEHFDQTKEQVLKEKQKELFDIRQKKMDGVRVRSRARWVEEGEKATRYFCNLENRNFVSKMMPNLVKNDGGLTSTQEEIVIETKNFYETLYSHREVEDVELATLFDLIVIPKLSENQKNIIRRSNYNRRSS